MAQINHTAPDGQRAARGEREEREKREREEREKRSHEMIVKLLQSREHRPENILTPTLGCGRRGRGY